MGRTRRILGWGFTVSFLILSTMGYSQKQEKSPDSPVFKDRRPSDQIPRAPESDYLQQIWDAFLTARKAEAGDKFAQHELGLRYIVGRGVERDTTKAAYWFERASEQGLIASKYNIAVLSLLGWGVPWNPFRAFSLDEECAATGMPEAEFMHAVFLTEGLVVPKDWNAAYEWDKKAADAGYQPAIDALPEFEERTSKKSDAKSPLAGFTDIGPDTASSAVAGTRLLKDVFHGATELRTALGMSKLTEDSSKVDSAGLSIVRRAARFGSPEALTVLGRCYEKGIEVPVDSITGAAYFVRAIRLESPKALDLMLALLQKPSFIASLKQHTEKGSPVALFVTAGLAGLGIESGVNEQKAAQLLRKSAEESYVPAMVELGLWHYSGRTVPEDRKKARELWYQAAAEGSIEASIRLAVTTLRDSTDTQAHSAQVGLLRGASEEGSLLAEVALGYCYEEGISVRKDMGEASRYYRSAASRGSRDAYRALTRMYDAIRPNDSAFKIPE